MKTGTAENSTAIITTRDGDNWSSTAQPSSGDPDVIYDKSGVAHWTFIDQAGKALGYRRSTDGGLTWSATRDIAPYLDHPHVTIDRSNSAYAGSIYAAGRSIAANNNVIVAYSRNGGTSWSTTTLNYTNGLGTGFVYSPTVLSDGSVVIPMTTKNTILTQNGNYAGATQDIYALRSTDGGQTFTAVHVGTHNSPAPQGAGGFAGLSNLAVGPNGSGGERLYLAYTQDITSAPSQLVMVTSDDGGATWSPPTRIAAATPPTWGAGSCSLMVNNAGVVGVQFYSISPGGTSADLYFTYSSNDGATFSTPLRVSAASFTNSSSQPRWYGQDQVYADDDSAGVFHLVWTDTRDSAIGNYTVYSRTVTLK